MSYLVLARKYRPHNFEELVGQSHVVQALSNALTQQRLHHAYLFTGTRGVGKTTVSRILAKSLNCTGANGQGGITASPCGVCPACKDIDAGRFVDYIELDAASNRGVEEISQLLDQAVYKPVVGRFKVYMIDEVHMLSNTAFNAMLKTLEEPPEYLKFVLATTDPQKVPPTVLSRCLQFNLRPMAPATVQSHLAQVLADENIAADAGALRLLSRAARGSMRDALSLTDQAIAFGAGRLTEDGVRHMLGAVDRSHCVGLLESLAANEGSILVDRCRALREQGVPAAGTLEELAELCQKIAVFKVAPGALSQDAEDSLTLEAVSRLSGQLAADELQLFYSMCLHGRTELHLAPDEHSALLMVMLRMLAFRVGSPVQETVAGVGTQASSGALNRAATLAQSGAASGLLHTSVVPPQAEAQAAPASPPTPSPRTKKTASQALDEIPPWIDAPPDDDVDAASVASKPEPVVEESPAVVAQPLLAAEAVEAVIDVLAAAEPAVPIQRAESNADVEAVEPSPEAEALLATEPAIQNDPIDVPQDLTPVPVEGILSGQVLGDRWANLVKELIQADRVTALTRALAWTAECTAWEEGAELHCVLKVEREMLRAPNNCEKLRAAMAEHLQIPVALQVENGPTEDTPVQRYMAEKHKRQEEAERIIFEDPLVQSILQQFSTARIVPGSIQTSSNSGETP